MFFRIPLGLSQLSVLSAGLAFANLAAVCAVYCNSVPFADILPILGTTPSPEEVNVLLAAMTGVGLLHAFHALYPFHLFLVQALGIVHVFEVIPVLYLIAANCFAPWKWSKLNCNAQLCSVALAVFIILQASVFETLHIDRMSGRISTSVARAVSVAARSLPRVPAREEEEEEEVEEKKPAPKPAKKKSTSRR